MTEATTNNIRRRSAKELVRDVRAAGGCSHPIRLRGSFVNSATGELSERGLLIACKDRRAILCPSCSYLYKADAWILVSTGLLGGKGVPESVSMHPRLFLTLTAPSFGRVHTRTTQGHCHLANGPTCRHAVATCTVRHDEKDPTLGTPLCTTCFDYRGAILWNAESSRLWNRTIEQVRRRLALTQGVSPEQFSSIARLSYLKVAEFQRRGLVHFHVVLRLDGPGEAFSIPGSEFTSALLSDVLTEVIATFSLSGPFGDLRWGKQFHVADASALEPGDQRIAGYLAKYATKTTDDSIGFARRFSSRRSILALPNTHSRQLALTSWNLSLEPELSSLKLRPHAHAFGYPGQLITKSRYFSTRFRDLREVRAAYMRTPESDDPITGSFGYEGRGYDDPQATELAEWFHKTDVERRQQERLQKLSIASEGEIQ